MGIFLPLTQLQENPSKTVGPRLLPQPPSPTCPSLKELPLQGEADSEWPQRNLKPSLHPISLHQQLTYVAISRSRLLGRPPSFPNLWKVEVEGGRSAQLLTWVDKGTEGPPGRDNEVPRLSVGNTGPACRWRPQSQLPAFNTIILPGVWASVKAPACLFFPLKGNSLLRLGAGSCHPPSDGWPFLATRSPTPLSIFTSAQARPQRQAKWQARGLGWRVVPIPDLCS